MGDEKKKGRTTGKEIKEKESRVEGRSEEMKRGKWKKKNRQEEEEEGKKKSEEK